MTGSVGEPADARRLARPAGRFSPLAGDAAYAPTGRIDGGFAPHEPLPRSRRRDRPAPPRVGRSGRPPFAPAAGAPAACRRPARADRTAHPRRRVRPPVRRPRTLRPGARRPASPPVRRRPSRAGGRPTPTATRGATRPPVLVRSSRRSSRRRPDHSIADGRRRAAARRRDAASRGRSRRPRARPAAAVRPVDARCSCSWWRSSPAASAAGSATGWPTATRRAERPRHQAGQDRHPGQPAARLGRRHRQAGRPGRGRDLVTRPAPTPAPAPASSSTSRATSLTNNHVVSLAATPAARSRSSFSDERRRDGPARRPRPGHRSRRASRSTRLR